MPDELAGRLAISMEDILNECDLWIDDLFDIESSATHSARSLAPLARVSASVARALVDVNRDPADVADPDGPVKSQTSYGRRVYVNPLSNEEKAGLVEAYWRPFHSSLNDALATFGPHAKLFLDCHSMAQTGPSAYGDPGQARPLICLSNLGAVDTGAEHARRGPTSCTPSLIREAASIAEEVFANVKLIEPLAGPLPPVVSINRPYPGGYILRRHSANLDEGDHLPPGMMIEINRGLYVGNQDADTDASQANTERIEAIRALISEWLIAVIDLM